MEKARLHEPTMGEENVQEPSLHAAVGAPAEELFSDLAFLAREVCGTPVALLVLFEGEPRRFQSQASSELPEPPDLPTDRALREFARHGRGLMVLPDATLAGRFTDSGLARGENPVRFFAGIPVAAASGEAAGILCALDRAPRTLTRGQALALEAIGRQAAAHLKSSALGIGADPERAYARPRESEERLRLALRVANQGFYDLDFRTGEASFSPEYATMLGRDPDTLRLNAEVWASWLHPDDRDEALATLAACARGERLEYEAVFRLRAADGEWRWIGTTGRVVETDGAGVPTRMVGMHTDVTRQRRAEEMLRERSEELRRLQANLPGVVFTFARHRDGSWSFPYVSDGSRTVLGLEPAELERDIGLLWSKVHPDDRERLRHAVEQAALSQEGFHLEFRHIIGDEVRWHDCRSQTKLQPNGDVYFHGVMLETTARRQAEESLRAKTQELDEYFSRSLDLLCIANTAGRFVRLNPEWERVLGYRMEEMVGRLFLEFVHPEDKARTVEATAQLAAQREVANFTNRYRRKDGEYRWIEWKSFAAGETIYAVARDITERRAAEAALRETEFFLNRSQQVARIGSYKFEIARGTWTSSPSLDDILGVDEHYPKTVEGWLAIVAPEHRQEMNDHLLERVVRQGRRFDREYRILRHRDGQTRWVWGLGELERDASGAPVRMIGTIQDITERKLSETRIAEALALNRSMIASSPIGISTFRSDGDCVAVNEALASIVGGTMEQVRGLNFRRLESWRRSGMLALADQALDTGTPVTRDLRTVTTFGKHAWLSCRFVRFFHEGEAHLLLMMMDITERRQLEEMTLAQRDLGIALSGLHDLRSLLLACLEAAMRISGMDCGGIYWVEEDTGALLLACHSGIPEELVRAVSRFEADSFEARLVREGRAARQTLEEIGCGEALAREGLKSVVVLPIRHQDRAIASVNLASRTVEDLPPLALQTLEAVSAQIGRDIARIRAETALRDSEERLRLALAAGDQGMFDVDLTLNRAVTSPEFARLLGYDPDRYIESRERWLERLHPEEADLARKLIDEHLEGASSKFEFESRQRTAQGEWKWILTSGQIARDGAGKPVRMLGTITDVSARKRAEQTLRASLEEKMALLKEVHHRVKNNLQVIVSILNLQAAQHKNPEVLSVLRDTQNRVHSMASLHETLYQSDNLARIHFPTYLDTLGAQLLRAYGPEGNRVRLVKRTDDVRLPLEQAVPCGLLINELITNSLKHAFPNGRSGQVLVELRAIGAGRLRLVVADDGIGVHRGPATERAGTLGMRLVQALAKQLKGAVEWEREPGTRFSISFPAPIGTMEES